MSEFWLKGVPSPANEEFTAYSIDEAKTKFEVRELAGRGWLVLNPSEGEPCRDTYWLRFAVLEHAYSSGSSDEGYGTLVFRGEGPTGSLRECRHTYWGEDGYLFCPNAQVIVAAFSALSELYDDLDFTGNTEK